MIWKYLSVVLLSWRIFSPVKGRSKIGRPRVCPWINCRFRMRLSSIIAGNNLWLSILSFRPILGWKNRSWKIRWKWSKWWIRGSSKYWKRVCNMGSLWWLRILWIIWTPISIWCYKDRLLKKVLSRLWWSESRKCPSIRNSDCSSPLKWQTRIIYLISWLKWLWSISLWPKWVWKNNYWSKWSNTKDPT